jgi:hypothetical protein
MATPRVVPAFDEIEDREPGLPRRPEPMPVQELALERREEAFAERFVEASPTLPIDGRTPASAQRWPKATDVYWQPWSEG